MRLNNEKCNLRIWTIQGNQYNRHKTQKFTSKYLGVSWYAERKKWIAQTRLNGKNVYLGIFKNEIDAAQAYNKAAVINFGAFANLNIVGEHNGRPE